MSRLLATLVGVLLLAAPVSAEPITIDKFTITDGDTIHLNGAAKGTRLVGFNAPETRDARCDKERELGDRASERLEQMVMDSSLDLTKVACSCKPGTEGTNHCNFGRSCATLRADGRDVGEILIAEGLAVPFRCGATSCPPTPRPWCE
jgi:micrococcal nuclease